MFSNWTKPYKFLMGWIDCEKILGKKAAEVCFRTKFGPIFGAKY